MAVAPDDIVAMEQHFRTWLTTAKDLTLANLVRDSLVFVDEMVSASQPKLYRHTNYEFQQTLAVSSWKPEDPPLPPLVLVLSKIFQRISVDRQTVLFANFFEKVVKAHDQKKAIPRIPPHLYPKLNPIESSTISPVVAGKRKAVLPVANQDDTGRVKRQRTTEVALEVSDSSVDGEDEPDGDAGSVKDMDEEEQAVEGHGSVGPDDDESDVEDGQDEEEDDMDVDQQVEPHAGRGQSSELPPDISPHASALAKYRPFVEIFSKPKAKHHSHPANGLTAAELEADWRHQAGDAALKFQPLRSEPECDHCRSHSIICWTVPGQTACVSCRYDKKKSCSNTPTRNRAPKEPKQPKDAKTEQGPAKPKSKKPTALKDTTSIVPPGSQQENTKRPQRVVTAPQPVTPASPKLQRKHTVTVVRPLPPVDPVPFPATVKVKVRSQPTVKPPPPAATSSPSSPAPPVLSLPPEPIAATISKSRSSIRAESRSRAASLSEPAIVKYAATSTADLYDPLTCPPASDSEVRCKFNHDRAIGIIS